MTPLSYHSSNLSSIALKTMRLLELTHKCRGNDTFSLKRKTESCNSTMSGGLLSTQNFSVKFYKVNWPTFVNGSNFITRENSISFSPTGANIKSEKLGELPRVFNSLEHSQTRKKSRDTTLMF